MMKSVTSRSGVTTSMIFIQNVRLFVGAMRPITAEQVCLKVVSYSVMHSTVE